MTYKSIGALISDSHHTLSKIATVAWNVKKLTQRLNELLKNFLPQKSLSQISRLNKKEFISLDCSKTFIAEVWEMKNLLWNVLDYLLKIEISRLSDWKWIIDSPDNRIEISPVNTSSTLAVSFIFIEAVVQRYSVKNIS